MKPKHIAVIDPAVKTAELDCFNHLALRSPISLSYHLPALFGMSSLTSLQHQITAFIVLGSATSVHDRNHWQQTFEDWLLPQLKLRKPLLGFCYGHQMIAHLFGGTVSFLFSDKHKLQGFRKIQLSKSVLWKNLELEGSLYVSHREQVTGCPANMKIVASSPEVPIDGLAHNSLPIWTLQAHPEATPVFLSNMGDTSRVEPQAYEFGQQIIDYFFDIVTAG